MQTLWTQRSDAGFDADLGFDDLDVGVDLADLPGLADLPDFDPDQRAFTVPPCSFAQGGGDRSRVRTPPGGCGGRPTAPDRITGTLR